MLKGLEGISQEEIAHDTITKPSDIKGILDKGIAGTSAGSGGAINVWKDDDGWIRCEAMVFCVPKDKKIFDNIEDTENWIEKWLAKIQ